MLNRREIKDLSATGHPRETAELILSGIKGKKEKSKKHIDDYHSVSVHFIPKDGIVNIDVHEGNKLIAMYISYELAVSQARELTQQLAA